MMLVAPESEVKVSQVPKLVLRESITAILALVSNANSFPLSVFQRVCSLVLLTTADEAAAVFVLLLTPTALLAAVSPPPALEALAFKLWALLLLFRLRGSGLVLVVSRRCHDCQHQPQTFSSQSFVLV